MPRMGRRSRELKVIPVMLQKRRQNKCKGNYKEVNTLEGGNEKHYENTEKKENTEA
jgi:hypothetical protein